MSKRDDFKLDAMSNIDEYIVDKNLKKRFDLWFKRGKPRIKWTPIIAAAACFILVASSLLVLIPILWKDVPTYTGMTASKNSPIASANADFNEIFDLCAINQGILTLDNSNNVPSDGNENTDSSDATETDALEPQINAYSAKEIFYASAGKDFYITVHIDNPDNYEILSFTLNGKKYSSYMFEEGSDMENIVLKCNAGDLKGITEYTIDAIKYIDGTEIKDVRIGGDQTIKVGLYSESILPTAVISNEEITCSSISFNVTVSDEHSFIDLPVVANLYIGKALVETKVISVNEEVQIKFENLSPETKYTYSIITAFDDLSGDGFQKRTLYSKVFSTLPVFEYDYISAGCYHISFDYHWNHPGTIVKTEIYLKGTDTLVKESTDSEIKGFDNLEILKSYTLKLTYTYDLNNGAGLQTAVIVTDFATQSEGLNINDGTIRGIGSCTDTELYINMPVFQDAFQYDDKITKITFGADVGTISNAFSHCSNLTTVIISEGVYAIDDTAFYGCTNLTSVTLPDSIEFIDSNAFYDCVNLISITIPSRIVNIEDRAFYGCEKLVEVINNSRLDITAGSEDFGYVAYYAKEVHNGESKIVNKDGYLFYTDNAVNYLLGYVGSDTELVLPESYNGQNYEIYQRAFENKNITKVVIPDSVTSIGSSAFDNCYTLETATIPTIAISAIPKSSLKTVVISGGTFIEDFAFSGCTGLTSITIPNSVTSIGHNAFEGCTGIIQEDKGIYYVDKWVIGCKDKSVATIELRDDTVGLAYAAFGDCDELTSVTLPSSVKSLSDKAFGSCDKLTSITLGKGIESIHVETFMYTEDTLSEIIYQGTKDEWYAFCEKSDAPSYADVICTDGTIYAYQ